MEDASLVRTLFRFVSGVPKKKTPKLSVSPAAEPVQIDAFQRLMRSQAALNKFPQVVNLPLKPLFGTTNQKLQVAGLQVRGARLVLPVLPHVWALLCRSCTC
mgnify:CR=1 FL=1